MKPNRELLRNGILVHNSSAQSAEELAPHRPGPFGAGPSDGHSHEMRDGGRRSAVAANTAVGYLRRSTDRQEQSIPDQQRAIERYCTQHGLRLLRCYVDDAISGTSTVGRHGFQSLIADAQSSHRDFAVIVCYDVKRFGRVDNDEAGYYRHVLRNHGVQVRYASENFSGDGTDDLLRPVKQWQAREESKDLSKVTIRGLLTKSESGFWMGGSPPFGYDLRYESHSGQFLVRVRYAPDGTKDVLDDKGKRLRRLDKGESIAVSRKDRCRLVPGEKGRIAAVEHIFRMYVAEGRGFRAIADALNRERVATARGPAWAKQYSGQWAMTTVRAILVNPAYCGDMVWNRRTDARFHRIGAGRAVVRDGVQGRRLERNERADWIVVKDAHPPLVTRRLWDQAQKRIAEKPESSSQRGINTRTGAPSTGRNPSPRGGWTGPRARYLLSGLCTCARCGSRYEGYTSQSSAKRADGTIQKWYSYACGAAIRRGPSACRLGLVRQEVLEAAVVQSILGHFEKFAGPSGLKRLRTAVQGSFGAGHALVLEERDSLARTLAKTQETIQNLLDNITAVNRALVDERLAELIKVREALRVRADELATLVLSQGEVKQVFAETAGFLSELEQCVHDDELGRRQAALRRCVRHITIDFEGQKAVAELFTLPIIAWRPDQGTVETTTLCLAR
jgi:DNA invertase Pin-like site-specific DNA recombinase